MKMRKYANECCRLPKSLQNVQVSDTTKDDSSNLVSLDNYNLM